MPRNSIGILTINTTISTPTSILSHFWRLNPSQSQHVGFFSPPENNSHWYWPTAAVRIPTVATFVVAYRMFKSGSGLFPFATAGIDVIRLPELFDDGHGYNDPLSDWPENLPTTTIGDFINDNFTINNAVIYVVWEQTVYLLGGFGNPQAALLGRISQSDFVAQDWSKIQYLVDTGSWQPYSPTIKPKLLFDHVPSETTVTFHRSMGLWVLPIVNTFESSDVLIRTSPSLSGPWSNPISVYIIPQSFRTDNGFCYAPKIHQEFSLNDDSEVVLTFNCNTDGLGPLTNRPQMYIPQVIRFSLRQVVEGLKF